MGNINKCEELEMIVSNQQRYWECGLMWFTESWLNNFNNTLVCCGEKLSFTLTYQTCTVCGSVTRSSSPRYQIPKNSINNHVTFLLLDITEQLCLQMQTDKDNINVTAKFSKIRSAFLERIVSEVNSQFACKQREMSVFPNNHVNREPKQTQGDHINSA